jgi:hypothetical protein
MGGVDTTANNSVMLSAWLRSLRSNVNLKTSRGCRVDGLRTQWRHRICLAGVTAVAHAPRCDVEANQHTLLSARTVGDTESHVPPWAVCGALLRSDLSARQPRASCNGTEQNGRRWSPIDESGDRRISRRLREPRVITWPLQLVWRGNFCNSRCNMAIEDLALTGWRDGDYFLCVNLGDMHSFGST